MNTCHEHRLNQDLRLSLTRFTRIQQSETIGVTFQRTSHTTPKSNSHLKICFITSESGIPGDSTQNSERKIPNGQNFGIVSDRYSRSEEEKLQQGC